MPPLREVRRNVRYGRTAKNGRGIVPAELAAGMVRTRIEAIASLGGQVDAPNEGDAVVNHNDLLVVAMHGTLFRVGNGLDLRPGPEFVHHTSDVLAIGAEERQR
jgi:hypothetical protein